MYCQKDTGRSRSQLGGSAKCHMQADNPERVTAVCTMLSCWACSMRKKKNLAPKKLRSLIQAGSNSPYASLPVMRASPVPPPKEGTLIEDHESLFHQVRGEVERLNLQIYQAQSLRQFINLFAQGLHFNGCHRLNFRARITVIEL